MKAWMRVSATESEGDGPSLKMFLRWWKVDLVTEGGVQNETQVVDWLGMGRSRTFSHNHKLCLMLISLSRLDGSGGS